MQIEPAPLLPLWLESELPFYRRRIHLVDAVMHFIDEGTGRPVLLIHGNPTWSFLWRKVIVRIAGKQIRAIAPDLIGFGLSDKPARTRDHTLKMHIERVLDLVSTLDLTRMTIVGQDMGGPVAAGVAARVPERVRAAVFLNTAVLKPRRPLSPKTFHKLSHVPLISDALFRGLQFPIPVMDRAQGDRRSIGRLERRAYRYPFRRFQDRAGPLAMARMVPNSEAHPSTSVMDEIGSWAERFAGRVALVWGNRDPILGRSLRRHRAVFTEAEVTETDAGHFLQEEVPDEIAAAILSVTR